MRRRRRRRIPCFEEKPYPTTPFTSCRRKQEQKFALLVCF
jgi:hypothetical protein